jgi:4-hydroxy-tetrahydrodipicolinate reductase
MSAPVVMLVDMIARAAANYPGTLKDWEIRITESHQHWKKDISGTALTIGKIMQGLGVNFTGPENIRAVRDGIEQLLMGIPRSALGGHGWHKYSLLSPDGNVMLGFEHNINGRDTYVDGTLKALDFLVKEVAAGSQGHCFSMQDVMRG